MKLTILEGDVFERISQIPDNSVDLCITSPPYWGLRNYNAGAAELGAEPTMEAYLDNTMRWVKEVWRVLKPTGSFVLNIGDCFIGGGRDWKANSTPQSVAGSGIGIYKTKQLLSVSSFAYCRIVSETDFVCRGEHIWAKPNVPSPIRSRLKHSHEKIFWFVKDPEKYFFNQGPWMKKIKDTAIARAGRNQLTTPEFANNIGLSESSCFRRRPEKKSVEKDSPHADNISLSKTSCFRGGGKGEDYIKNEETIEHSWRVVPVGSKQNKMGEQEKKASLHVAPYPEKLITPYIKSLCPDEGVVLDPFLGSGTTMYVSAVNGRNCIGIELSEKYVEHIKWRMNWNKGLGTEYLEAI